MARLWRATRVEHVATAEQTGAHEVGRGPVSFARGVRVQLQDEPWRRMAETVLRGAQIDPGSDPRRRGGVAQTVEGELVEICLAYCRQPHALTEVRVEQRTSGAAKTHESAFRAVRPRRRRCSAIAAIN